MEWLGNRITNPINLSKFILIAFALVAAVGRVIIGIMRVPLTHLETTLPG
jgi:hypothetical protein